MHLCRPRYRRDITLDTIVHFNPGTLVENAEYWDMADYITVVENPITAIPDNRHPVNVTENGARSDQSVFMYYHYPSGRDIRGDVDEALNGPYRAAGLFISDFPGEHRYNGFGPNFKTFVQAFDDLNNDW